MNNGKNMLLRDEEIKAFGLNQLELDCSQIILTPLDPSKKPISGIGSIFQKSDGRLHFKIYSTIPDNWRLVFPPSTLAGQIIPDKEFYNLEAMDSHGRIWKSQRPRLDFNSTAYNDFVIIKGIAESISSQQQLEKPLARSYLNQRFYQSVEIPANCLTKKSFSVAKQTGRSSSEVNGWKFESNNYSFLLWTEESVLNLRCHSSEDNISLPSYFDLRALETIRFITGCPLIWSLQETGSANFAEIILKTKPTKKSETRLNPPISYRLIVHAKETQKLFDLYLAYIKNYPKPEWHPISQHVYAILNASGGSLETEGLTLGVEIEGLAKQELTAHYPKPLGKEILDKVCEVIEESKITQEIKARVTGFIRSMTGIKAHDVLRELSKKEIISQDLFNKWKKLRNTSAHSEPLDSSQIQEYLDLCHANTVLLYHLIFFVIGYRGIYTNYQQHGFPEADYNPQIK
ncbi:MAG: hypothetical protein WC530_05900 [Candidatus Omnitrophota bacterium]